MTFKIDQARFQQDDRPVDQIPSTFIGGSFSGPPKIVVLHFTYGGTARSSANWFRDPRNPGSSAHVVIERDGAVIQCVPLDKVAWHAGKSRWRDIVGLNTHSFGIELANWGYLKKAGDGWSCYTGTRIPEPFMAIHRNGNPDGSRQPLGWEPYPRAQFEAAVDVVRAMVERYGITEIVGHEDISPTRKWDPGPAFDMARFRAAVFGGRRDDGDTVLKVTPASGVNLRRDPSTTQSPVELLKQGTLLEPIATDGLWLQISVLEANGLPRATGWVHSHYVAEV
jgi:N-acetylmuramoyl-L-alanine amidase